MKAILLIHTAATWFMVGLIWFVQITHYPLFNRVGNESFIVFEAAHSRLTTWVVGPPMLIELITAVLLLWQISENLSAKSVYAGIALLAVIWLSTLLIQVPRHNILSLGFDEKAYNELVVTNWIRTVAWSLRGILTLAMLAKLMK